MKKFQYIFFLVLFLFTFAAFASEPFRFALFSDLHISSANHQPSEDLLNAVNDVNALKNIDFVLVSGDVSNLGDTVSLKQAKQMLERLHMPYYIVPGNHDIRWSEPQATNFKKVFLADKFSFIHNGYQFIGFATAPPTKTENAFIQPKDIEWIKTELEKSGKEIPVFVITHYPLQTGDVDNWKDMTDVLLKYNIKAVLNGHYHRNVLLNYNGIPGIVNRSTLRAGDVVGGYSIYSVSDSIKVSEKRIGQSEAVWLAFPINNAP